jgi:hypothetical protein
MTIRNTTISVTGATGGAGVATANAISDQPVNGLVLAVYLEYLGSPPAGTTDVAVVENASCSEMNILTVRCRGCRECVVSRDEYLDGDECCNGWLVSSPRR